MSIHIDASITRKRTREAGEAGEVEARPVVIKDSSDPFARPRTFTPICLLARAQLPLADLDTATAGSRIFSAHVPVLESSYEHGGDTTVLVANERDGGRLYAIERVKRRCYALCRLGEWVTAAEVKERSMLVLQHGESPVKKQALERTETGVPWWKSAAVEVPSAGPGENGRGLPLPKLAMRRVMEAPQKTSEPARVVEEQATLPTETEEAPAPDVPAPETHISPQDVPKELGKHYLEALYLSRTSLAYFTKGPLSRARAACTLPDSNNDVSELIQFLRESLLSSAVMDKKYRDGIAGIVNDMPLPSLESPDKTPQKPTRKKTRKWKPKRDRDGFFTDEHEYVERWWRAEDEREPGASAAEKMEAATRRRVTRIRNRETFLQIIIVLEILALEAAIPLQVERRATASEAQDLEPQRAETQTAAEPKKTKARKKKDLPALLETLLDKLCIWHSLESHSPAKKNVSADRDTSDDQNDELKSFCIEVIIPFYLSRIPQYATIVNKKLGGPSAPTPIKRKSSAARKPGEPAMRQPPDKKPRKPLARVSTETLNRPPKVFSDRPPSLQRSATDSESALHIKREGSEVPMESIPPVQPPPGHSRRPSLFASQLKTFSKREVDLSAVSAMNEAKMRKKKDVEAKLKEAVEMLKKPNRALAVKEMEERTDERFATVMKKGKAGHRVSAAKEKTAAAALAGGGEKMGGSGTVHVTSTPKHVRAVKPTPRKGPNMLSAPNANAGWSESATTDITSSSSRLIADQTIGPPTSTPAIPQTGHRPRFSARSENVQGTPSRGFAKFMPPGLARLPGTLESPAMKRATAAVLQTPSKARLAQPFVAASPNVGRVPEKAGGAESERDGKSIYDALGWDDDGYEQLA